MTLVGLGRPSTLESLNHARIWRRRVRIGQDSFRATSFDRLAYLGVRKYLFRKEAETVFFQECILPGMHVVDGGANLGIYSHIFGRAVGPSGRVSAFEPDIELFAALSENLDANGLSHVQPQCMALGAERGTASLYRGSHNSGETHLTFLKPNGRSIVPTPVTTLDDFLAGAPVDFIKLDIQGWELHALRGMTRTLSSNPRLQLYIELSPYCLAKAGCSPQDLIAFLASFGFDVRFQPQRETPSEQEFTRLRMRKFWFTEIYARRP